MSAWRRKRRPAAPEPELTEPDPSRSQDPGGLSVLALGDRAVAVGRDNTGIISIGERSTNVQYTGANPVVLPETAFAPVGEVVATAGLMNVPVSMRGFVGRKAAS